MKTAQGTNATALALELLHEPGEVFEVRILNTPRAGTVSGYFNDPAAAAQAIAKWDGKAPGVYATINPVMPDLLARACNRLAERVRTTTADHDVSRRRWLLVDVDAERPAGISASDEEWQAAHDLAAVIRADLAADGWPAPVVADSGNGAHLLYRVDLPNDNDARDLVSRCLTALAARFNTDGVHVDTAVFNAARIVKVPGTLVCKGDSMPTRPHRTAALLTMPTTLDAVPVALLAALAGPKTVAQAKPARGNGNGAGYGAPFDVKGFMTRHGLDVYDHKEDAGADLWHLDVCPFNSDHRGPDSWIRRGADGTLSAGCFHQSCFSTWAELREHLEPRPVTYTAPPTKAAPAAEFESSADSKAVIKASDFGKSDFPNPTIVVPQSFNETNENTGPPLYQLADPDGGPGPQLAALWAAEAEAARTARLENRPRGPVTGFVALDRELGGYLRPGLHFIHGEPGTGKTNLALQIAVQCGAPALFVSCEMSPLVLVRRLVANLTDTHLRHLEDGERTPAAMLELFASAAKACPGLALMDATRTYPTPAAIRAAAESARARYVNAAGRVLVVIDSLHTWAGADPSNGDASEYDSLNRALARLQALAADLDAPVLVVAERNRPSMGSAGQSAAKGTARIEYSAESIVSLNRVLEAGKWQKDAEKYLSGDGVWRERPPEYHVIAQLVKNRSGCTGPEIPMRLNGAVARLREV